MLWADFFLVGGRKIVRPFDGDGPLVPYWQRSKAAVNCSCFNCRLIGGYKWNGLSTTGTGL